MADEHVRGSWLDRAAAWVAEKWADDVPCPYCQASDWTILGVVDLVPSEFIHDPWTDEGDRYPVLQVACTNCAHVVLVNAAKAGATSDNEGEDE